MQVKWLAFTKKKGYKILLSLIHLLPVTKQLLRSVASQLKVSITHSHPHKHTYGKRFLKLSWFEPAHVSPISSVDDITFVVFGAEWNVH